MLFESEANDKSSRISLSHFVLPKRLFERGRGKERKRERGKKEKEVYDARNQCLSNAKRSSTFARSDTFLDLRVTMFEKSDR